MKLNIYLVALLLCLVPRAIDGFINFCARPCLNGTLKHSCCKPPIAKHCLSIPMTFDFRRAILKAHNRVRAQIQMGTRNVLGDSYSLKTYNALQWDMELEFIAGCWAKQCARGTYKCNRHTKTHEVSQSVGITKRNTNLITNVNAVVEYWYQSFKEFYELAPYQSTRELEFYSGEFDYAIGNFANVVNVHARHVGCYRTHATHITYVVCLYYPRPRWGHSLLGNNTENCTLGPNQYYPNLCGKTEWPQMSLRKGTTLAGRRTLGNLVPLLCLQLVHLLLRRLAGA